MRKLLTFLCAALMSASMFALTPLEGDVWNEATKTLTVNSNLPNNAYREQHEIEHVIISNGVTSIGNFAFYWDSWGLKSVTIPSSVVNIGHDAFYGGVRITDVYCYADPNNLTWNDDDCNDFMDSDHGTVCHVKSDHLATYLTNWGGGTYNTYQGPGVNVNFVGDLPVSFDITPNVDPKHAGVYYSTFFHSSGKYVLPSGVEAYVATISEDDLLLTKIAEAGQVIPNNNAVILKSTESSFTLIHSEADAVTFSATNSLQGVDSDTEISAKVTGTCYVLSGNESEGVGFFEYEAPSQLQAHKAFVDRPNGAGAPRRMRFVYNNEQVATGVTNTNANANAVKRIENGQLIIIREGVRYNAQGQRMD